MCLLCHRIIGRLGGGKKGGERCIVGHPPLRERSFLLEGSGEILLLMATAPQPPQGPQSQALGTERCEFGSLISALLAAVDPGQATLSYNWEPPLKVTVRIKYLRIKHSMW